jgi:hypothetical protein
MLYSIAERNSGMTLLHRARSSPMFPRPHMLPQKTWCTHGLHDLESGDDDLLQEYVDRTRKEQMKFTASQARASRMRPLPIMHSLRRAALMLYLTSSLVMRWSLKTYRPRYLPEL